MSQATGDPNTVSKAAAPVAKATPAPIAEDAAPWEESEVVTTSAGKQEAASASTGASKAEDILAMIRNRQK